MGAAHGAPVWVRLQPGKRRGLYYFDNRLRKFFFIFRFEPIKQTRAKSSRSLALTTEPRACHLPRGRAGRGARLLPSSRQQPAGPAAALRGGGGSPGRNHTPPAFASGLGRGSGPKPIRPVPPSAAQPLPSLFLPGGLGGGKCPTGGRRFGAALAGWECEEEKSGKRRRDSARARERALVYRLST